MALSYCLKMWAYPSTYSHEVSPSSHDPPTLIKPFPIPLASTRELALLAMYNKAAASCCCITQRSIYNDGCLPRSGDMGHHSSSSPHVAGPSYKIIPKPNLLLMIINLSE